jgi:hypothetical protein
VPKLTLIKQQLGVPTTIYSVSKKTVVDREAAILAASEPVSYKSRLVIPSQIDTFGVGGGLYNGPGSGANFQIVASVYRGVGLPYRFYNGNNRPQGQSALSGRGYSPGELIIFPYNVFRGTSKDNNATITVLRVNSVGAILAATIIGTTADVFYAVNDYLPPSKTDLTNNEGDPEFN